MNKVHLIIGILALLIGFFLIAFGVYKIYNDETTGASAKSTNLGWGLTVGGIIFLAIGIILFVAGRNSNVSSISVSTKKSQ